MARVAGASKCNITFVELICFLLKHLSECVVYVSDVASLPGFS